MKSERNSHVTRLQRAIRRAPFAAALLLVQGCADGLSRAHPPKYSSEAGADALRAYDSNNDGSISGAELDRAPALRASLKQIDTDGNGQLTAQEIDARVKSWQASRIAEMPVRCKVTMDGVPLADADILFAPESFLGPDVKPAHGATTASGTAGISLAKENLADPRYAGVACGWYTIRVTSPSQKIPARYNTASILGCEVAMNAAWVPEGEVKIDLKSKPH